MKELRTQLLLSILLVKAHGEIRENRILEFTNDVADDATKKDLHSVTIG